MSLLSDYKTYATQYPDTEIIGGALWDTVQFTSAAINVLTFFGAGNPRASLDLGNMELPSQLASPKAFLVRAFRFFIKQQIRVEARTATGNAGVGAIDNVAQLVNTGWLALNIGSKVYAQFPLWMIPAAGGVFEHMGVGGAVADPGLLADYAQNGVPHAGNSFTLSKPLFISPQINFNVVLTWPAAITLAGGNTNLTIVMDGDLLRPVQ